MLLNVLRISASNVLKMFLNIIVSIECTFVIFHCLHSLTNRKHKNALLITRYYGRQERNKIITNK